MPSATLPRWLACLCALLVSGCLGAAGPAAPVDMAAVHEAEAALVAERVYEFDALVLGAGVPDPLQPHGAPVEQIPAAHWETFEVPEGAVALDFDGEPGTGSGMARIEVVAPDGRVVWASIDAIAVGVPGVVSAGLFGTSPFEDMDEVMPGEYTVVYRVAGAFRMALKVDVDVPAAPAAA